MNKLTRFGRMYSGKTLASLERMKIIKTHVSKPEKKKKKHETELTTNLLGTVLTRVRQAVNVSTAAARTRGYLSFTRYN